MEEMMEGGCCHFVLQGKRRSGLQGRSNGSFLGSSSIH